MFETSFEFGIAESDKETTCAKAPSWENEKILFILRLGVLAREISRTGSVQRVERDNLTITTNLAGLD
jgi:hypothetical protein